jgi:hypothetical protein
LSRPANAAGGFLSETHVKRHDRIVGVDTELIEKLGGNDPCPAAPGDVFRRCCRSSGNYDDTRGHYYVRD